MGNTECTTAGFRAGSLTELVNVIDWTRLAAPTRDLIRTVGSLMAQGLSISDIAAEMGESEPWVTDKIDQIRRDLLDQAVQSQPSLSENARALVAVEQLPPRVRKLAKDLLVQIERQRLRLDVLETLAAERI